MPEGGIRGTSVLGLQFRVLSVTSGNPVIPEGRERFPGPDSRERFKRAVKRNRVKRLIRETYRLNKNTLYSSIPEDKTMDILFIYLHDEIFEYGKIEKAITGAIKKIRSYIEKDSGGDIADTH